MARVGELKWADINFRWRSIAIRDKVEGQRMVPLTPYVAQLHEPGLLSQQALFVAP